MKPHEAYCAGMSAYNAGRYADAIAHLRPLAEQPGTVGILSRFYLGQAHYRLAVELYNARRFAAAVPHFQAAATLNPHGDGFGRYLIKCHVGSGRFDLAAGELERLLQHDPCDAETRVRLALSQWKAGAGAAATSTLHEGLRLQPDSAELSYQMGVLLATQDDLAGAEACFERAASSDPQHAKAFERLAQCCSATGRHERAMAHLQRAAALDPANARIGWQLAILAESRPEAATEPLKPAAATLETADLDRLGEAVISEPEFVEAFLSLPASAVDGEVFSILAATLEQALGKHPEYADLHYHCGTVYRRLGRSGEAIEHAERAVKLNPKYVNALVLLAQLYGQTDRWADGLERIEQAMRAGADYPDVHFLAGQLLQKAGRLARARKEYRRALQLNAEYQEAKEALAALAA